jgi:AcrR family transcriptional regulator
MSHRPYHHGDLREALLAAGLETARAGGPDAIGIRTLATAVGVSPTAAYRHFRDLDEIVAAVAQRSRETLARQMRDAMDAVEETDPVERAWAHLRASGRAYVRFATGSPELFRTAFTACATPPARPDDPDAWGLLLGILDDLRARGALAPMRVDAAAVFAWATVHGLASILTGSRPATEPDVDAALAPALDALRRGLSAGAAG